MSQGNQNTCAYETVYLVSGDFQTKSVYFPQIQIKLVAFVKIIIVSITFRPYFGLSLLQIYHAVLSMPYARFAVTFQNFHFEVIANNNTIKTLNSVYNSN